LEDLKNGTTPPVYGEAKYGIGAVEPEMRQEMLTVKDRQMAVFLVTSSLPDLLLGTMVMAVALFHAPREKGVSLYCLAMQVAAHMISSLLLLARLIGEYRFPEEENALNTTLLREKRLTDLRREKFFSNLMGVVLMLISTASLFKVLRKARRFMVWQQDSVGQFMDVAFAARFLTPFGAIMYAFHAGVRFYCYRKLQARIIFQAFIVSAISVLFCVVLYMAAGYEKSKEWKWKAEPIASLILSVGTLGEAIYIMSRYTKKAEYHLQISSHA